MRSLINYIRSLFCTHDMEKLTECEYYNGGQRPYKRVVIYRCKICGYVQRIRL